MLRLSTMQVTLLEISGWSGGPLHLLRSAAAQQLQQIVESEVHRLGHASQPQPKQQEQECLQQQGQQQHFRQQEHKQQSKQQEQDKAHQQGSSQPHWTSGKQRKPRLGVLRTSLGPDVQPGLLAGPHSTNEKRETLLQQHPLLSAVNEEPPHMLRPHQPDDQTQQLQQQPAQWQQQQNEQGRPQLLQQGLQDCLCISTQGEVPYLCEPFSNIDSLNVGCVQGVEVVQYVLGDFMCPNEVGQQLFTALRVMDTLSVDAIVVEGVMEQDAGAAVMNRLRKASSTIIPLQGLVPTDP